MNGVQIEYLLGLYFLITSVTFVSGRFSADAFKLIAAVVLIVLAIVSFSLIR